MKKYFLRIIIVLIIVIPVVSIANKLIFKGVQKYFQSSQKDEFILRQDTTNYDFLLLGSSRILTFVNPRIIDSALKLNCYNYARSGGTLVEDDMLLKSYLLKHKAPKNILLGVDLFSFYQKVGFYPNYLNYFDAEPIKEELSREGIRTSFYQLFPCLKTTLIDDYNRGAFLRCLQNKFEGDVPMYKGYSPNGYNKIVPQPVSSKSPSVEMKKVTEINEAGKRALSEIIDICKEKKIKLIMTYSPEYDSTNIKSTLNALQYFSYYDSVAKVNNLPFLQNQTLPMCKEGKYFANPGHVNISGAELYSNILAEQLLQLGVSKR